MPAAIARHILVASQQAALDLKKQIDAGGDFASLAKSHSTCPSGRDGGNLGRFSKGDMVPEFDAAVFGTLPVGHVSEPIKTQFGYHLIKVEKRFN